MMLLQLIRTLENYPPTLVLPIGFHDPHSYRGYYECLAFQPTENVTVGSMLECAKSALGATFSGWKSGDYTMTEYTDVYLAQVGSCGEELGPMLLGYMLRDAINPDEEVK